MAAPLTLLIANKNYSSWSLRAWLALKHVGAPFEEVRVLLGRPETSSEIRARSPSGRVPFLEHGEVAVWDSIAICEYLAEVFPEARLWPVGRPARAVARAVSAEMHAGFSALRRDMPMNVRARMPGLGRTQGSLVDIDRVLRLWADCRARFGTGGPFLFGRFSAADAMYAPVVSRFATYEVKLDDVATAYCHAVQELPAMQEWTRASREEPETVTHDEYPGVPVR